MKHKYRSRIQGESLQLKIRDIEYDIYETYILPSYFVVVALFSWLVATKWFRYDFVSAIILTLIAIAVFIWSVVKVRKLRKKLLSYRKGLEGERLVGELLNGLCDNKTAFVFHDVPGDQFNVDHILVSTRGVFVIETKHFDRNKSHEFYFDGEMIYRQLKNGKKFICPKLLPQMDGEASFIQSEIERRTDLKIPVTKVAVIVGCFVHTPTENSANKKMKLYFDKYWIVNESLFPSMFTEEPEIYDESVVKHIASHIKEWIKIDVDG